MLLYTLRYKEYILDVLANEFHEVLREMSCAFKKEISENEITIKSVVEYPKIKFVSLSTDV